ncbi:MAG: PepSY-like domain-containing protein [Tannerellaceae bacterium]
MGKKLVAVVLLACSMSLFANCKGDDRHLYQPTQVVLKTFESRYPSAERVTWETKQNYQVAEFYTGANKSEAWFDGSGVWVMTETDISFKALPSAVKTSFNASAYATWKVDDVDQLERMSAATIYIIETELGEKEADLRYSETGLLIKVIFDAGKDDKHQPVVIPELVRTALLKKYPNALILEYEMETTGLEVDILDKGIQKDVCFNNAGQWLSSEWDIRSDEAPAAVLNFLATSAYSTYRIDEVSALEKPAGMFYVFDMKQNNNEVTLTLSADGVLQ